MSNDIIVFHPSEEPDASPKLGDKVFVDINNFAVFGTIESLSEEGGRALIRLADTVEATFDRAVDGYGQIWTVCME